MATPASINDMYAELQTVTNDATDAIWPANEKKTALKAALKGLYPHWWQHKVATTAATANTVMQAMPVGCVNIFAIYRQPVGSVRARPVRNWQEGTDGYALVPQSNIGGDTLVWCWTAGFAAGTDDTQSVPGLTLNAEKATLVLAEIDLVERVMTDKARQPVYFTSKLRQGTSEHDLAIVLDTLEAKYDRLVKGAIPLPERRG